MFKSFLCSLLVFSICMSAETLLEEVTAELAGLTVTVRRTRATAASGGAASGGAAAGGSSERAAEAASTADHDRFYVVFRCRGRPELRGIWNCPWKTLERVLPGGRLAGSGAYLRRYHSLSDAVSAWHREFPDEEPRRLPEP